MAEASPEGGQRDVLPAAAMAESAGLGHPSGPSHLPGFLALHLPPAPELPQVPLWTTPGKASKGPDSVLRSLLSRFILSPPEPLGP